MPLTRLIAEGVGPFDRLELDLSDGNGQPHLGPHILAGVNGSGKSTVLRTIAWALDRESSGFDYEQWGHSASGHRNTRALILLGLPLTKLCALAVFDLNSVNELFQWPSSECQRLGIPPPHWAPGRIMKSVSTGLIGYSAEPRPTGVYKFVLRHMLRLRHLDVLERSDREIFVSR